MRTKRTIADRFFVAAIFMNLMIIGKFHQPARLQNSNPFGQYQGQKENGDGTMSISRKIGIVEKRRGPPHVVNIKKPLI